MRAQRLLASCLLLACWVVAQPIEEPSLPSAPSADASSYPGQFRSDTPWYLEPMVYYVIGGTLLTAGIGVTMATDGCGSEQPGSRRCEDQFRMGQLLGFPGLAVIGIGLLLESVRGP